MYVWGVKKKKKKKSSNTSQQSRKVSVRYLDLSIFHEYSKNPYLLIFSYK